MSQKRKQRLLGFLLLLSLAVIFLPMILDGSGYRERQLEATIPAAPSSPQMQSFTPKNKPVEQQAGIAKARPQPVKPAAKKEIVKGTSIPKKSKSKVTAKPKLSIKREKPVLDVQGVPVVWTIQLASFKDATNARQLRKKLLDKGYKAYVRRKGEHNKVFVGPDNQRTALETLRLQLKKEFKLDGLILRFTTS